MATARLLAAVAAVLLIATTMAGTYQIATRPVDARSAIMREALRVCMSDSLLPRSTWLTQGGTITILLNEHTEGVTMQKTIKGYNVITLDKAAIDEKMNREGPFQYLVFSELTIHPDGTALVRFHTTGVFDAGAGGSIRLTQHDGVWLGEGGVSWIA